MLRKKEERFVVVFDSTAQAMSMEKHGKLGGLVGRLIPIPSTIRAGCGLAWSSPVSEKELIKKIIMDNQIESADEMIAII